MSLLSSQHLFNQIAGLGSLFFFDMYLYPYIEMHVLLILVWKCLQVYPCHVLAGMYIKKIRTSHSVLYYCTKGKIFIISAFEFFWNYLILAALCADRIFNFSQICKTDYVFWDTDAPVITCFTWQIQSEMTREVQTRQTCDPASLLSFWHHLILYSFILQGPRCFLLVQLSCFHIWEQ